jgi:F-type H+-transporting ATPase subunit c
MSTGLIALAAAIAVGLPGAIVGIGMGMTAREAMSSIARQPESTKDIRSTLIIALALMEALVIYGLLIAFMIIGKI